MTDSYRIIDSGEIVVSPLEFTRMYLAVLLNHDLLTLSVGS